MGITAEQLNTIIQKETIDLIQNTDLLKLRTYILDRKPLEPVMDTLQVILINHYNNLSYEEKDNILKQAAEISYTIFLEQLDNVIKNNVIQDESAQEQIKSLVTTLKYMKAYLGIIAHKAALNNKLALQKNNLATQQVQLSQGKDLLQFYLGKKADAQAQIADLDQQIEEANTLNTGLLIAAGLVVALFIAAVVALFIIHPPFFFTLLIGTTLGASCILLGLSLGGVHAEDEFDAKTRIKNDELPALTSKQNNLEQKIATQENQNQQLTQAIAGVQQDIASIKSELSEAEKLMGRFLAKAHEPQQNNANYAPQFFAPQVDYPDLKSDLYSDNDFNPNQY